MNYFKVYQSQLENKSYVANLTDLEKVLHMFIQSEFNKREADSKKKNEGKTPIYKFTHYMLSASLSTHRKHISYGIKNILEQGNYFNYIGGYHKKNEKSVPSMITELAEEKFFVPVDRYTFQYMLLKLVKQKKIKYKHIVAYVICKYIEQFKNGSTSINELGHMLGFMVENVKYSRIKPILEALKELKLLSFDKKHGKIENVKVMTYENKPNVTYELQVTIRKEAADIRNKEFGIAYKEISASIEDLPTPQNFDDIITNVKDMYAKRTGLKVKALSESNRRKILNSGLSENEIYELVARFFEERENKLYQMQGEVFNNLASYIQAKSLMKNKVLL